MKEKYSLIHNPGYDFKRLVYWMNTPNEGEKNIHIAAYFIPVIALLGACFSLEGYINMVGQHVVPDWSEFDKGPIPVKDRLKKIYFQLDKPLDCSHGIWQKVLSLFRMRVKLVHPMYVDKVECRSTEIPDLFQLVEEKYSPEHSKQILEQAVDTLLKDAELEGLKDETQTSGYVGPIRGNHEDV